MDKGKENLSFSDILCSKASQANTFVNQNKPVATPPTEASLPDVNATLNPKIVLQCEKPKTKPVVDSKSLFNRLVGARLNAKKAKELTLMACLIGKFVEFSKVFTKLRMDWRNIKGEINFSDQKGGWFEIVFSNPLYLMKIWENRPYDIGGQLLFLKHWTPEFDPTTEPISTLDLWIRIFKLLTEYKNPEALTAILEANNFGTFLKLDPIHLKRKWIKFVRLCVNTNVEQTTGQKLIIPDEFMVDQKYNVWFDDFPVGCGNCGEIDHVFNDCPDKTPAPPSITITLKKPTSKKLNQDDLDGPWTKVGSEKGQSSRSIPVNQHGHKPYLADNDGIAIIYELDVFSEHDVEVIVESNEDENCPNTMPPGNGEVPPSLGLNAENITPNATTYVEGMFPVYEIEDEEINLEDYLVVPPPDVEHLVGGHAVTSPSLGNQPSLNVGFDFEEAKPENQIIEEEEVDPNEAEEDDPEEMNFAEDLEAFIAEHEEDYTMNNGSGNSFHSTHQSLISSSSMVNQLGGLAMNANQMSKSGSSKRKTNDGEEDTATSNLMGAKKPSL